MAWIHTVEVAEADGPLAREYDAAVRRAGRVFNIVKLQSLRPEILRPFMQLYMAIMHGDSRLSRAEREMVATIVSRVNHCHY